MSRQRIFALADVAKRESSPLLMVTVADLVLFTSHLSLYVTYNGKVYDLTPFLADHPGGDDVIVEYAGKDVGAIMGDANSHVHSRSAYEMMDEYKVGELGGDEKIVSEGEYRA
jgi:4-hydroxysphinganine ceramide fatty acyl 2-hydroxylase